MKRGREARTQEEVRTLQRYIKEGIPSCPVVYFVEKELPRGRETLAEFEFEVNKMIIFDGTQQRNTFGEFEKRNKKRLDAKQVTVSGNQQKDKDISIHERHHVTPSRPDMVVNMWRLKSNPNIYLLSTKPSRMKRSKKSSPAVAPEPAAHPLAPFSQMLQDILRKYPSDGVAQMNRIAECVNTLQNDAQKLLLVAIECIMKNQNGRSILMDIADKVEHPPQEHITMETDPSSSPPPITTPPEMPYDITFFTVTSPDEIDQVPTQDLLSLPNCSEDQILEPINEEFFSSSPWLG